YTHHHTARAGPLQTFLSLTGIDLTGDEKGDGWAALSRSRVPKGHGFDEVAQRHKRREMEGLDKGAVGPQREGLRPIPGISGAGDDHHTDVCTLGDGLDMP